MPKKAYAKKENPGKDEDLKLGDVLQYGNDKRLAFRVEHVLVPLHAKGKQHPEVTMDRYRKHPEKFTKLKKGK